MLGGGEKWDLDFSCFVLGGGGAAAGRGWVEGLRGKGVKEGMIVEMWSGERLEGRKEGREGREEGKKRWRHLVV